MHAADRGTAGSLSVLGIAHREIVDDLLPVVRRDFCWFLATSSKKSFR